MNHKSMIGIGIFAMLFFGIANAQQAVGFGSNGTLIVPDNAIVGTQIFTFNANLANLNSPLIVWNISNQFNTTYLTSFVVPQSNTTGITSIAYPFSNFGNHTVTLYTYNNNTSNEIGSTVISVAPNPLYDQLYSLSNQTRNLIGEVNSTNTLLYGYINTSSNQIDSFNISLMVESNSLNNNISTMNDNLNTALDTMNSNTQLFTSEIGNTTNLASQTSSLLSSYMNSTNGELGNVASDLTNLNTSITNVSNAQSNGFVISSIIEVVMLGIIVFVYIKLRQSNGKFNVESVEHDIKKRMEKEIEDEKKKADDARINEKKLADLQKMKADIKKKSLSSDMKSDEELIRLRNEYIFVKEGATKNKITLESLPEFRAYRKYIKDKYGMDISEQEEIKEPMEEAPQQQSKAPAKAKTGFKVFSKSKPESNEEVE